MYDKLCWTAFIALQKVQNIVCFIAVKFHNSKAFWSTHEADSKHIRLAETEPTPSNLLIVCSQYQA